MTSETYTVLLGAFVLCAWGSLAEIVQAVVRQQAVSSSEWMVLVIPALAAVEVWLLYRSKVSESRSRVTSFKRSIPQGVALLCVYMLAFVLPGFLVRGADLFDLAIKRS